MGEFQHEEGFLERECKTVSSLKETVNIICVRDVRTKVDDVEVLHLKQMGRKVKHLNVVVRGFVYI